MQKLEQLIQFMYNTTSNEESSKIGDVSTINQHID